MLYLKKLKLFAFCCILLGVGFQPMQAQTHTFTLGTNDFILDGKPFQIISGELHPSRIPRAYWKDRLQKAKAMGLNAISIYVMWNALEPEKGKWDFSGRNDIREFVKLAQQEGLYVILRPGPYVCAEWEFGGFPWWLLKDKDIKVRTDDLRFMSASENYLVHLGKELEGLEIQQGGPIILVQVENEYGSFGSDKVYEEKFVGMLKKAGFTVPFFTADGDWLFKNAALPGILPGGNGETNPDKLKAAVNQYNGGHGPYFVPELYPGWLDHWGEPFQKVSVESAVKDTKGLLDANVSINYYMFHGGTDFDFMNGANYDKEHPIQPDITSYDYDAPLSESGVMTPKYMALRQLLSNYLPKGQSLPPLPAQPKFISIPEIHLNEEAALFDNLPKPVKNENLLSFEDLNQGYGYVLYRTILKNGGNGTLTINGLRDFGQVFVNGKPVGTLNRMYKEKTLQIKAPKGARLDILVENLGRINYGHELMNNRKGIIGEVNFAGNDLKGWDMYGFPFNDTHSIRFKKTSKKITGPAVYKGSFNLNEVHDTYLDLSDWGKGIVFVNGHNLGRYWNIGPQQALYLPAPWLKKGENSIVVFEQLKAGKHELKGIDHPILDNLKVK